jgi:hypothetical protein
MGENSNVVLKTRFLTSKKGGGGIDLGTRHDVNEAGISTWETHSSTAVMQRTFRCSNLKLFDKQPYSAQETEQAAGNILLSEFSNTHNVRVCMFMMTKYHRHSQVEI